MEFADASEYNRGHILSSCMTAVENRFENNSVVQSNSILGFS